MPPRTIAVDGPAGAGKTTVGRRLADALDYMFFDTGVLYRALTLAGLESGTAMDDAVGLGRLAATFDVRVEAAPATDDGYRVFIGARDVTSELRGQEVDDAVALVSSHGSVRTALLERQRQVAGAARVVMVGRDIGTVVMPDADLKIYLDASPGERARRRLRQLIRGGAPASYTEVLGDVQRRDARDASRAQAPLRAADDAVLVVTDDCSFEDTVKHIRELVSRWPELSGEAPCRPESA